jgi:hypothetical protein
MLLSNNALHLVFIWHFLKLTYFMPGHTDHQSFNHSYVAIVCFLSLFKCSSYAKVPKITFLDEIQPKVLRVFPCYSQSHLYNFALRFLFLLTHATSYSFYSSVTVHCRRKEKNLIENHTPFRNPYRNLKSEIWEDYAQNLNEMVRSWILLLVYVVPCFGWTLSSMCPFFKTFHLLSSRIFQMMFQDS